MVHTRRRRPSRVVDTGRVLNDTGAAEARALGARPEASPPGDVRGGKKRLRGREIRVGGDQGMRVKETGEVGSEESGQADAGFPREDTIPEDATLPLIDDDVIGRNEHTGKCPLGGKGARDGGLARRMGAARAQEGLVIHKRMSVQRSKLMHGASGASGFVEDKICVGIAPGRNGRGGSAGEVEEKHVSRKMATMVETTVKTGANGSPDGVLAMRSLPSMPTDGLHMHASSKETMKRTHRTRSRVEGMTSVDCRVKYPVKRSIATFVATPITASVVAPPPSINSIPDDCLRRILMLCATDAQRASVLPKQNPLLSTLPLVCKKWRSLLDAPSDAWSTMTIDLSFQLDYPLLRRFMEARSPSIRHIKLTNEKRVIQPTAQRGLWTTILLGLGESITSHWESLRIEDVWTFDVSDFFLLGSGGGVDPSRLASLKSLDLSNLRILPNICLEFLQRLPNLEKLRLSFAASVTDGVPAFDGCAPGQMPEGLFNPKLKSLAIHCKCIESVPESWLNRMVNLEELRLEGILPKQAFPAVDNLCKLKTLGLTGSTGFFGSELSINGPVSLTERMFALFKSMPVLEELIIDGCGIKEIPMAGNVLASPTVKHINMNNNPDMVFKKGLSMFQGLEELSMQRCNMPCVSSAVTSLVNLKFLDVSNNGLVECHNLGKLKVLEKLVASNNPFPSIPRDVVGMASLRSIDLSGCLYLEFNSALEHLMEAWPKLTRLDVRKCTGNRRHTMAYQAQSQLWLEKLQAAWQSCSILFYSS